MKKKFTLWSIILSSFAGFFFLIYLLLHFFGSNIYYLYTSKEESDGFLFAMNKISNCVYVGLYNCTEYEEAYEITIPDSFRGMPVTNIGGYYGRGLPTPFQISLSDLYMNVSEDSPYNTIHASFSLDSIKDPYTIENVVFQLNIGKNVKHIEFIEMDYYFPHINDDNTITLYHPVVNIHCTEENEYFYSENGKLYHKETNELIPGFSYAEP